jgi:hypothetical protein
MSSQTRKLEAFVDGHETGMDNRVPCIRPQQDVNQM